MDMIAKVRKLKKRAADVIRSAEDFLIRHR